MAQEGFEANLGTEWVAITDFISVVANKKYYIQNRGPNYLLSLESDSLPNSLDGTIVLPYKVLEYTQGEGNLYLRAFSNNCSINITSQDSGGGGAVIESLSITPSTSQQLIYPTSPHNGFDEVNVDAVTSSIDANIQASNIKDGVTILGVTGNFVTEKYGTSVNTFLGDVDANGQLQPPTSNQNATADFSGIYSIYNGALYYRFARNVAISAINFDDLEEISSNYACSYCFSQCSQITSISFPKLLQIAGSYCCQNMFNFCSGLVSISLPLLSSISGDNSAERMFAATPVTNISLPSLTTIGGTGGYCCQYMFNSCTQATSADLSSLTTINAVSGFAHAFEGCTQLSTVDLSSLETIVGNSAMNSTFYNCRALTSVDLSSLQTITSSGNYAGGFANAFSGCISLSSIVFNSLNSIASDRTFSSCFSGCTSLTTLSFPALTSTSFGSYTTQFNNMLSSCSGVTVHFPSNLQSVIGSWADVTAGFGGTNTTVLFDLTATN